MKKFKFVLLTLPFLFVLSAKSQDISFTQFFNSPLFLNSGFAGSTPEFRVTANTRIQWPSLENPLVTQAISLDYNLARHNSGIGALISVDDVGPIQNTSFNALYSYKINLDGKWIVSPGLQAGYVNRNNILGQYTFYSDILLGTTDEEFATMDVANVSYFDFGTGVVFFNRKVWGGFSVSHLNRPVVSLTDQVEKLDMTWSIHGGYRITIPHSKLRSGNAPVILPSFIYRSQGDFDQLELAAQVYLNPMNFGVAYKGASFRNNEIENSNVLAFIFGLGYDRFEFGYSYDFFLTGVGTDSGGAHEISLIYEFRAINWQKKKLKRYRGIMNNVPPFYREKWFKLDPSN